MSAQHLQISRWQNQASCVYIENVDIFEINWFKEDLCIVCDQDLKKIPLNFTIDKTNTTCWRMADKTNLLAYGFFHIQ